MSISSLDDTNSTEVSDREYDSEHDSDVNMCMEDDVDAPDSIDLDGDVDMERDGDDEEEEEEDEEDEDEEKEEDEDEDEDEDDGKELRTIGQGEMVHTSAEDVDTMGDDQPTVLPGQRHEMREYTSRPQPPAPGPRPHTPEPCALPQTPVTHPLSGLEVLQLVTPQNLAQRRQLCEKLWQPETHWMSIWISSYSANRQVATVSTMSVSPMSLSLISLSLTRAQMSR